LKSDSSNILPYIHEEEVINSLEEIGNEEVVLLVDVENGDLLNFVPKLHTEPTKRKRSRTSIASSVDSLSN
jgi:hypothetical protein